MNTITFFLNAADDSDQALTCLTLTEPHSPNRLWVTDMCVLENVNKLVITTTSREMYFYDMSTKTYSVQFLLFGEYAAFLNLLF